MNINKDKLDRQLIGVDKWFNSSKYGAIKDKRGAGVYVMGFGKTYLAILVIKRLFEENPLTNIVIIVPANVLQQWEDTLKENLYKKELKLISLFTPHYIVNNEFRIQTDVLIVDEMHECYSTELCKVIDKTYIRYSDNLGLTGTYEDNTNRHLRYKELFPVIDRIDEKEGIEKGYIAPYIEFNIAVTLTEEEQALNERYSKEIANSMSKFPKGYGFDLASKCLKGGKDKRGIKYEGKNYVYAYAHKKGWRRDLDLSVPYNREINDLWNPSKIFGYATNLFNSVRNRKTLLYNASNKIKICIELCEKFSNLKTIVFSQSTNFADKLDLLLNDKEKNVSVVYHSQLQTIMLPSPKTGKLIKFGGVRLKRRAIERIKTGESRIICTASSLDKGFDVQDMGLGITASGTSNFNQYKQRGGRTKRIDIFNKNKLALLVNLYIVNSQEEKWLKERQSKSNNKVYWVSSVDEISFSPVDKADINFNSI